CPGGIDRLSDESITPTDARALAGPGAEEEARLRVLRGDREGEVARHDPGLEPSELQERADLGRRVEAPLGILNGARLEELPHDVAAPFDGIDGELPHDPERALAVPAQEDRVRGVPPAQDVEDELARRREHRSDRAEGRDQRRSRYAVEDAAEDRHEIEGTEPRELGVREIGDLEAEARVFGGALARQGDGDRRRV